MAIETVKNNLRVTQTFVGDVSATGNFYNASGLVTGGGAGIDTEVRTLSSNWQNTSTVVQTNSAQWASNIDTGVRALSSSWVTTNNLNANFLPLSGGTLTGATRVNANLTVFGNLSATGNSYFANTVYTTTSALSVINTGNTGPAFYVGNNGTGDVASFYDLDQNVEVLHVGGSNGTFPNVGIKTSTPGETLTVSGTISSSGVIYSQNNNSAQWNSAFTTVGLNSATNWKNLVISELPRSTTTAASAFFQFEENGTNRAIQLSSLAQTIYASITSDGGSIPANTTYALTAIAGGGGGGGGGQSWSVSNPNFMGGGGGGGGAYYINTSQGVINQYTNISIIIGAGGAGGTGGYSPNCTNGSNGQATVVSSSYPGGGGGGAGGSGGTSSNLVYGSNGSNGGNGGGGGAGNDGTGGIGSGGAGTSGLGVAGENGSYTSPYNGGRGGGRGGVGSGGSSASANTGGGGGGGSNGSSGGNGGSGLVIIRYAGSIPKANGGSISMDGSYVYHTFTTSGTLQGL